MMRCPGERAEEFLQESYEELLRANQQKELGMNAVTALILAQQAVAAALLEVARQISIFPQPEA